MIVGHVEAVGLEIVTGIATVIGTETAMVIASTTATEAVTVVVLIVITAAVIAILTITADNREALIDMPPLGTNDTNAEAAVAEAEAAAVAAAAAVTTTEMKDALEGMATPKKAAKDTAVPTMIVETIVMLGDEITFKSFGNAAVVDRLTAR